MDVKIMNFDEKKARATSVFVILPMVITSGFFYMQANFIDWGIGIKCAIGGIIGGFVGAKIMKKIPKFYLALIFDIFLIGVSIKNIIQG